MALLSVLVRCTILPIIIYYTAFDISEQTAVIISVIATAVACLPFKGIFESMFNGFDVFKVFKLFKFNYKNIQKPVIISSKLKNILVNINKLGNNNILYMTGQGSSTQGSSSRPGNTVPSETTSYVTSTDTSGNITRLSKVTLDGYIAEFKVLRANLAKGHLNSAELNRYLELQNNFITHNNLILADKKIKYNVNDIYHNPLGLLTATSKFSNDTVFPVKPSSGPPSDGSYEYQSDWESNGSKEGSVKESTPPYEGKGKGIN